MNSTTTFIIGFVLAAVGLLGGIFVGWLGLLPGNGNKSRLGCAVTGVIIAGAAIPRFLFDEQLAALMSLSVLACFFVGWFCSGLEYPREPFRNHS